MELYGEVYFSDSLSDISYGYTVACQGSRKRTHRSSLMSFALQAAGQLIYINTIE